MQGCQIFLGTGYQNKPADNPAQSEPKARSPEAETLDESRAWKLSLSGQSKFFLDFCIKFS
jgi:hypothetical protein